MARSYAELLARGEDALDAGEFEDALRLADEVLADDPDHLDALDLKASAQHAAGTWDAADETYRRLRRLEPHNVAWVIAAADVLIKQPGDDAHRIEAGLELLEGALSTAKRDESMLLELELLRGVAFNQLGETREALLSLAVVLDLDPDHPEARLEQGYAFFELGQFDAAKKQFEGLTRDLPEEPWAWHYLGLIAERRGQNPTALLEKAQALDPHEFPAPVRLTPEAFDLAVEEAIAQLPAHARPHLDNCVIDVQPFPSDEELVEAGLSPTILGVFRGQPIDERSPVSADDHQTARIPLFQNNLERFAHSREELLEEIRITVLHEVGHLLGLDEEQLAERGLD